MEKKNDNQYENHSTIILNFVKWCNPSAAQYSKILSYTAILILIEGQLQAFQRFSRSKLVLKTVESCFVTLNYYENDSMRFCVLLNSQKPMILIWWDGWGTWLMHMSVTCSALYVICTDILSTKSLNLWVAWCKLDYWTHAFTRTYWQCMFKCTYHKCTAIKYVCEK